MCHKGFLLKLEGIPIHLMEGVRKRPPTIGQGEGLPGYFEGVLVQPGNPLPALCPQSRVHHWGQWGRGGWYCSGGGTRKRTWHFRVQLCLPGA
jgi:hypothetical protein